MRRNFKRIASLVLSLVLLINTALSGNVFTASAEDVDTNTEIETTEYTEITSEDITTELSTEEVTTEISTESSTEDSVSTEEVTTEDLTTEEVTTEEVTTEEVTTEVTTEEQITTETTEEIEELSLIEEAEQGKFVFSEITDVEKRSFFKNTLTNVEYREWFKKLSNEQIKQYFGLEKEDFQKEMIALLLEGEPEIYLLDLPEEDLQTIFNMSIEEFEVYYEEYFNKIAGETEVSLYAHHPDTWYTMNIDGVDYSVLSKGDSPATGELYYTGSDGYTKAIICGDLEHTSPFKYAVDTWNSAKVKYTTSTLNNHIVDKFWNIYNGSRDASVLLNTDETTLETLQSDIHYYGHLTGTQDGKNYNRTAPSVSDFVVTADTTTYYDSTDNVQYTNNFTVRTGTSSIQVYIEYPSEFVLWYKDSSGAWQREQASDYGTTPEGRKWSWLSGSTTDQTFCFEAPASCDMTGNIRITSARGITSNTSSGEWGYYINNVVKLSPDTAGSKWLTNNVTNAKGAQTLYFATFSSVDATYPVTFKAQDGYLTLKKTAKNPGITALSPEYSLKRAIYNVYDAGGNRVAVFETDENGVGHVTANIYDPTNIASRTPSADGAYIATTDTHTTMKLPIGTYTVKEVEAPYYVSDGNKRYVYKMDQNGYTVAIKAEHTAQSPLVVNSVDEEETSDISIIKVSEEPSVTDGNDLYDLTGSEYTVWRVSSETATKESGTVVGKFKIINNNGDAQVISNIYYADNLYASTMKLPYGHYVVKETKEPDDGHYCLSDEEFRVLLNAKGKVVKDGNGVIIQSGNIVAQEPFENDPFDIVINKQDAETGTAVQGAGNLEGAIFRVCYYDTLGSLNGETPTKTWYLATQEFDDGKYGLELHPDYIVKNRPEYTSSSLYSIPYEENGVTKQKYIVPLGTLTIEEVEAPKGYTIEDVKITDSKNGEYSDNLVVVQIKDFNGEIGTYNYANKLLDGGSMLIEEQPIRGDFLFVKMDYETREVMANIPFEIESLTTGEKHVIYTNEQGIATTSSSFVPHTLNTNSNDTLTDYNNGSVTGIWFGDITKIDNSKGALPYDNYIVRELRCDANEGKTLETFEFSITTTDHGIIKQVGVITNMPVPELDTEAKDGATLTDTAMAVRNAQIVDTVTYKHLTINTTYKVKGYLMDKDTGLQVVDADGNPIVAETAEFTTPASSSLSDHNIDGSIDNVFNFDATPYKGCTFVVYEELYQKINGQWVLVAEHKDIDDEAQTIYFVSLDTKASIKGTDIQVGIADGEITIVDKVWYKGFNKNYEYRIEGALYVVETGEPVLDSKGNPVTTKKYFNTTDREGDLEVEFTFDASQLKGKSVVIVQRVYWNGSLFIEHNVDLTDTNEMIYFPEISTTAVDTVTRDHISLASEDAKIIDTVEYINLPVGNQYTLKGILMDKVTGEPILVNGKEVTQEKNFTPTEKDSTVDMEFEFDSTGLAGTEYVVFEELYYGDMLIASHKDINDEGQTITTPKIGTVAIDADTLDHTSTLDREITIEDTVNYSSVLSGKEYTIKGILMDKSTGAPLVIDGETVESEVTFTAEDTSGSVKLEYTLNSINLRGKTIVVFENMYYDDKLVAIHADINDENQTIDFPEPEIGTTAKDSETDTNVAYADEDVTIIDTVSYKHLVVGEEYTIKGILMLKSTEKPLLVDGKEVTSELTFKPEKAEGSVDLKFKFNGSALKGETIVVFERLYYNDLEIATHTEIDDEGQSVYFPEISTLASLSDGSKKLPYGKDVTVVDRITYTGLAPEKKYEVKGVLIDKSTGLPLETENGVVESKIQFTADNANGTVDVTFSFNTSELAEKELVVYEEIYEVESGKLVADHKDINDVNQTVSVEKEPDTPKTGDTFPAALVLLATLLSLVGIVTILFRKKLSN